MLRRMECSTFTCSILRGFDSEWVGASWDMQAEQEPGRVRFPRPSGPCRFPQNCAPLGWSCSTEPSWELCQNTAMDAPSSHSSGVLVAGSVTGHLLSFKGPQRKLESKVRGKMSSSQRMQGDSPAHTHARSLHCQDGFRSCSSQRDVPEHQEVRPSFPPASTHTCPPSQLVTSPLQPLEQLSLRQSVFIPGLEWPQDLGAAAVGASPAQPSLPWAPTLALTPCPQKCPVTMGKWHWADASPSPLAGAWGL